MLTGGCAFESRGGRFVFAFPSVLRLQPEPQLGNCSYPFCFGLFFDKLGQNKIWCDKINVYVDVCSIHLPEVADSPCLYDRLQALTSCPPLSQLSMYSPSLIMYLTSVLGDPCPPPMSSSISLTPLPLYILPCIHTPRSDHPLRIQIEGPLLAIQRLLPHTPWHLNFQTGIPQPAGLELARLAYQTVYGRDVCPESPR